MWDENGAFAVPGSRAIQCGSPLCPGIQRKWGGGLWRRCTKHGGCYLQTKRFPIHQTIVAETLQHNSEIWDFVGHTRTFPSSAGRQIWCVCGSWANRLAEGQDYEKRIQSQMKIPMGLLYLSCWNVHHENRLQPHGFPPGLFSSLLFPVVKCQLIGEISLLVSVVRGFFFYFLEVV